jgi:hypothetical protein
LNPPVNSFRRICFDLRLSDGAFRLWHVLKQHANKKNKAFPSQRTIAKEMGCDPHSLRGWISELIAAGYLRTERFGQHHHLIYEILGGDGRGTLPDWITNRCTGDVETNNARSVSHCGSAHTAMGKSTTPRVVETRNVSNSIKVNIIKSAPARRLAAGSAAGAEAHRSVPFEECGHRFSEAKLKAGLR